MKRLYVFCAVFATAITAAISLGTVSASAATCTATGFVRDNINLTAVLVNPVGTVTGTVNAGGVGGCNIGVYYGSGHTGSVSGATVENANYFGVVNNGGNVSVTNSTVTNIGETPLNGDQHGVGIYFAFEGNSTGTIKSNTVSNYQKGGIEVNGIGSSAPISENTVIGQGPVNYIAQNGIEVGYGATATVFNNVVTGNAYTGANNASSGGILVFGGPCYGGSYTTGVTVSHNTLTNNDVGIFFSNVDATCTNPPATATNDTALSNTITNNNPTPSNVSGNGYPNGYQAGISDFGNSDSLVKNKISGNGYNPAFQPTALSLYTQIDTSGSTAPYLSKNK